MTNMELSNAVAHDAEPVLPFITLFVKITDH